jgi:hypothetical protein
MDDNIYLSKDELKNIISDSIFIGELNVFNIIKKQTYGSDRREMILFTFEECIKNDSLYIGKLIGDSYSLESGIEKTFVTSLSERKTKDKYYFSLACEHNSMNMFTYLRKYYKITNKIAQNLLLHIVQVNNQKKMKKRIYIIRELDKIINFNSEPKYFNILLDIILRNNDYNLLNELWILHKNKIIENENMIIKYAAKNNYSKIFDLVLNINTSYPTIRRVTFEEIFDNILENNYFELFYRLEKESRLNENLVFNISSKRNRKRIYLKLENLINETNDNFHQYHDFIIFLIQMKLYFVKCKVISNNEIIEEIKFSTTSYTNIPNIIFGYSLYGENTKNKLQIQHMNLFSEDKKYSSLDDYIGEINEYNYHCENDNSLNNMEEIIHIKIIETNLINKKFLDSLMEEQNEKITKIRELYYIYMVNNKYYQDGL